jgi:hypothetical protein
MIQRQADHKLAVFFCPHFVLGMPVCRDVFVTFGTMVSLLSATDYAYQNIPSPAQKDFYENIIHPRIFVDHIME